MNFTEYGVVIVLSWVGLDFRHAKSQTNQHTRPHHTTKPKRKISRKNYQISDNFARFLSLNYQGIIRNDYGRIAQSHR